MSLDIYLVNKIQNLDGEEQECYWHRNITHNMGEAASIAGSYRFIWRPDEQGIVLAKDNIKNLRIALGSFYNNYDELLKYDPENGWGSLDQLIDFTKSFLDACVKHPNAMIEVSR